MTQEEMDKLADENKAYLQKMIDDFKSRDSINDLPDPYDEMIEVLSTKMEIMRTLREMIKTQDVNNELITWHNVDAMLPEIGVDVLAYTDKGKFIITSLRKGSRSWKCKPSYMKITKWARLIEPTNEGGPYDI